MGTNYYLRKKKPTIHETIHVAKKSWGWHTTWQQTDEMDWPRWCDEDPSREFLNADGELTYGPILPWPINSVDDIRRYLETGEWEVIDEYGDLASPEIIDDLENWDGGRANYNAMNPDKPITSKPRDQYDFRDLKGNNFSVGGFS